MAMMRGRAAGRKARDEEAARGVRERIDGFTAEKEAVFLAELERSGCVTDAARVVAISRNTVNRHRRFRPAFDAACKAARVKARGPLEAVAYLRAVEGGETKIIRGGKVVEVRVKPSDAMLKTLLQAADPEKYGRPGGAVAAAAAAAAAAQAGEEAEPTEEERRELVERVLRKMRKLRERLFREGEGLTIDGQFVPKGYGPVAPDAVPMMADPLSYTVEKEAADVLGETSDAERLQRAQGSG